MGGLRRTWGGRKAKLRAGELRRRWTIGRRRMSSCKTIPLPTMLEKTSGITRETEREREREERRIRDTFCVGQMSTHLALFKQSVVFLIFLILRCNKSSRYQPSKMNKNC